MKNIEDIKSSLRRSSSIVSGLVLLTGLDRVYENIHDSELLEYVPIKIVSIMEEHFRQIYKDIIDKKEYRVNLKKVKFLRGLTFDFDVIEAFQSNEISLGEYLSYHFPCSSVNQIFEHLGQLLGVDFRHKLIDKIIQYEGKVDLPDEEARKNILYFFKSIEIIFEIRHILCHEGGLTKPLDNKFIMQMISDSQLFVQFADFLIDDIMYPDFDFTQVAMNEDASQSFDLAEKQLEDIIEHLKNKDKNDIWDFSYLEEWKKYREAKAKCESKCCEGGSMYPTVYMTSKAGTTANMISQLKKDFRLYDWDDRGISDI